MIGYENYASLEPLRERMEGDSPDPSGLVPDMMDTLLDGSKLHLKGGFIELHDALGSGADYERLFVVLAGFMRNEITANDLAEWLEAGCEQHAPSRLEYLMEY